MTPELREKLAGRKVIASVSGGKDSAALSLWLTEQEIEHERVFMDTGWEHPDTYAYLRGPLTEKIGAITEIRGPHTFASLAASRTGFPGGKTRFCTQVLKLEPMQRHLESLMREGAEIANAVGIRREESITRATATEWEPWAWSSDGKEWDCLQWRPLVDWTLADVIAIHARHGLRPNPLYMAGFERVGCFPCINSNKGEIALLARLYPERIAEIRQMEAGIGARSNATPKPAFFYLRTPDGKKHRTPIDQVVAWAQTGRGGKQFPMFVDVDPADSGCMRWGLCDTGSAAATPTSAAADKDGK